MFSSPVQTTHQVGQPWRTCARALVLTVGVLASAVAGYAAAFAVMIVAVLLDAAPLPAGQAMQQRAWATPAAVRARSGSVSASG